MVIYGRKGEAESREGVEGVERGARKGCGGMRDEVCVCVCVRVVQRV